MGLWDDMMSDAKREALDYLNKGCPKTWRCRKCGKVKESDTKPQQDIFSMASDPCPASEAGGWHDNRQV